MEYTNFACPSCGNLASKPWDAVWCTHREDVYNYPPPHPEVEWVRMDLVTSVETTSLADIPWVVVEYQNPSGWRQDEWHDALPGTPDEGDDDWLYRVASAPMSEQQAREIARTLPRRKGWPDHMHDWKAYPVDLTDDMPVKMLPEIAA